MTRPVNDAFGKALVSAFNAVIDREIAEENLVRDEIKQKGTYWAGSEIWTLRRQVKALRRRLDAIDPDQA